MAGNTVLFHMASDVP